MVVSFRWDFPSSTAELTIDHFENMIDLFRLKFSCWSYNSDCRLGDETKLVGIGKVGRLHL